MRARFLFAAMAACGRDDRSRLTLPQPPAGTVGFPLALGFCMRRAPLTVTLDGICGLLAGHGGGRVSGPQGSPFSRRKLEDKAILADG